MAVAAYTTALDAILFAITVPAVLPAYQWLTENLGWIPFFAGPVSGTGRTVLTVAIVLAVMIMPIITALCREVFLQTPRLHEEAALALGATKWEVVKTAVLPFGRAGIISATMLGLGRALGETIAVALILSASYDINWHITEPGGNTFAANIALRWNEAGPIGLSALVASGLVLFVITLAVNMAARLVIARRAEFSGANG